MYVQSIGVISSVPIDMSDEEIKNSLLAECKIIKVERIMRWDMENQKQIPTATVKIWFRQTTLPKNVLVYLANVRVRHFIPSPIICKNCLRYGHTKRFCKDPKQTCLNCATKHDGACDKEENCKHCQEKHKTTSKQCPEYKKQQNIKRIMTIKRLSFKQALQEVENSGNFNSTFKKQTNIDQEKMELKKENEEMKRMLVECQKKLDKIHQAVAQVEGDKNDNDLILLEVIDTLRDNEVQQEDESMTH